MKKTTSEKLSNRLAKYGAFSAAILGVSNASGQIVYTDIADETVSPGAFYSLDLNNDGTGDYSFLVGSGGSVAVVFPIESSMASAYNANAFVGVQGPVYSSFYYPSNLNSGATIDAASPTFSGARGDLNFSSCAYSSSQFCGGTDGFIGFKFEVGANTHYGWARILVAADASSIIIKDYAFNATPDGPINAGQTLSVDESNLAAINIVAMNKNISLSNLTSPMNFNIFSVSGQVVLKGNTNGGDNYVIEANSMASGIYILELNDSNTNSVIRKKIVL